MKQKLLILAGLLLAITAVFAYIYFTNQSTPQTLTPLAQARPEPLTMEDRTAIARGEQPLADVNGNPIALVNPSFDWSFIDRNGNPERRAGRKGARAGREEQFNFMLTYPSDSIPLRARQDAYTLYQQQLAALSSSQRQALRATGWQELGPDPIEGGQMGNFAINSSGRTTAVLIHPTNPDIVYIGGAQGGVWKTTDGGNSYVALTDDQPSLAVGTMTLDPSNPNTIYVGTGEPHGSDSYYGLGILKSTNGGQTWQQLGLNTFLGLAFSNIVVHPNNPNLIYAATGSSKNVENPTHPQQGNTGVYRSTNGGQSWELSLNACGDFGCVNVSSLVIDPVEPNTLYAGADEFGVYKTTNGGDSWTPILNLSNPYGRVEVVVSPSNRNILYVGFQEFVQGGSIGTIYKSSDGGQTWTFLNTLQQSYCGQQCGYDNILAVHPTNPNILLAGGQALYSTGVPGIDGVIFRTDDGGSSWSYNEGVSVATTVHPDLHAIAFAPSNPNIVWMGNDGGVYKSTDGGHTWQERNNNLGTLQFQSVALHPTDPNVYFGGMQDNSKVKSIDGGQSWIGLDAGDGGFTAIDPFDPRFWYGTRFSAQGQFMQFQRNDQAGSPAADDWPVFDNGIDLNDRVLFYAPLITDPNVAGRVYWGTHRLYRSDNRGNNWNVISPDLTKGYAISAINVLEGNSNYIMTGSGDGLVALTRDGGNSWFDVTASPMPNRWVADVVLASEQRFYVAFAGFAANTPGTPGYVFRSDDGGNSWSDISHMGQNNGLPDLPVLSLTVDPDDANIVYAGTDFGVYRTTDGGQNWTPFSENLPLLAVFDLALHKYPNGAKQLVAATHGRSLWKMPLGSVNPPPGDSDTYLPLLGKNSTLDPIPVPTATATPIPTQTPEATATPQATATPTMTPTPTTGALPEVPNGDFEQGDNGDWLQSSTNDEQLILGNNLPVNARSGNFVGWLGGVDDEVSSLSQTFFLTDVTEPLYLVFYYQIRSNDDCGFDFASVLLDSVVVWQADLCSSEETGGWMAVSLDLGDYVGGSVTVEFTAETDFSVPSSFFIDDVAFTDTP